jgi:hypothetical protein
MNEYWGPETGDAARAFDLDDEVINDVLKARQIASGNDTE